MFAVGVDSDSDSDGSGKVGGGLVNYSSSSDDSEEEEEDPPKESVPSMVGPSRPGPPLLPAMVGSPPNTMLVTVSRPSMLSLIHLTFCDSMGTLGRIDAHAYVVI